jgi:hypothetical protein
MIFEQPLSYLLILIIFIVFILGVVSIIRGFFRKNVSLMKSGLFIAIIPIVIVGIFILYVFVYDTSSVPYPNEEQLVGTYRLVSASSEIDKSEYEKCSLIVKPDGKFTITPIPYINDCREGEYAIEENSTDKYSLYMGCGFESYIVTNHVKFQIKLMLGDNDTDPSERTFFIFEKTSKNEITKSY